MPRTRSGGAAATGTDRASCLSNCRRIGSASVTFGAPFDEADVRGICGIAQSTKATDLTEIGRFGIGFKSVYAFTDQPEVHSGDEDFAIESYVWPKAVPGIYPMDYDETVFILPFKDESAYSEINEGLKSLDAATLLFLSQIEEIAWVNDQGESGRITRTTESLDGDVHKVSISTCTDQDTSSRSEWLVFSRPVVSETVSSTMTVDIAFSLNSESGEIRPETNAKLYTYFPTHLETHVGFLMNGPYRTTLNRENIPPHDTWNKSLVSATAELLVHSLRWLRDNDRLDLGTLRCLPLEGWRFMRGLVAPLFEKTKSALASEPLLPKFGGGYVSGNRALMARTAELRDLFSPSQIRPYAEGWLCNKIRGNPTLQSYLTTYLEVPNIRPEPVIRGLDRTSLEAQTDEWIVKLYRFLYGRQELLDIVKRRPVVRLEGGRHVLPKLNGEAQAYLPTDHDTGFPTVARSVYDAPYSPPVLIYLGLTLPDPVDGVIAYILPKYQRDNIDVADEEYALDTEQILDIYQEAGYTQSNRLLDELKAARFVRSIDTNDCSDVQWNRPNEVYASSNMTELFREISDVRLIDNSLDPSTTSNVHALMNVCGASDGLRTVEFDNESRFTRSELQAMRNDSDYTWHRGFSIDDKRVLGLKPLLAALPELQPAVRIEKAKLLWQELCRLDSYEFLGVYQWFLLLRTEKLIRRRVCRDVKQRCMDPEQRRQPQAPCGSGL